MGGKHESFTVRWTVLNAIGTVPVSTLCCKRICRLVTAVQRDALSMSAHGWLFGQPYLSCLEDGIAQRLGRVRLAMSIKQERYSVQS